MTEEEQAEAVVAGLTQLKVGDRVIAQNWPRIYLGMIVQDTGCGIWQVVRDGEPNVRYCYFEHELRLC